MSETPLHLLVTGATGFIGRHFCETACGRGQEVRAVVRSSRGALPASVQAVHIGHIDAQTDWSQALADIDVVVHLAGRAHVFEAQTDASDRDFLAVNHDGTINLARQAAAAGVRRFVYVSSIGVNGVNTPRDVPFTSHSRAEPHNGYARSKWLAEIDLQALCAETAMEFVIIRPPLVYGPRNIGNFLKLMKLVRSRLPIPFASIDNRRSLIYVGNLADAILTCCTHPVATNKTYLVSDNEDISTPDLIRAISAAFQQRPHLLAVPQRLVRWLAGIVGKSEAIDRLSESLIVDSTPIRHELEWAPPYSFEQGLKATTAWFESEYRRG
jgi:nucleoside-diphosphate-sugar epimerase